MRVKRLLPSVERFSVGVAALVRPDMTRYRQPAARTALAEADRGVDAVGGGLALAGRRGGTARSPPPWGVVGSRAAARRRACRWSGAPGGVAGVGRGGRPGGRCALVLV